MVRKSPTMPTAATTTFRTNPPPGTAPGGQQPPPPYPSAAFAGIVTSVGINQYSMQQQQQQQPPYRPQQVVSPLPPAHMALQPFPTHAHSFMPFVMAAPLQQSQANASQPSTPPTTFPMPYTHPSARSPPLRPAAGGGPGGGGVGGPAAGGLTVVLPPASLQSAFSFGMGSTLLQQQQQPHNCGTMSDSSQRGGLRVATPSGDSEGSGRGNRTVPSKRNSQLKSRGDLNKSNARANQQHLQQHLQQQPTQHQQHQSHIEGRLAASKESISAVVAPHGASNDAAPLASGSDTRTAALAPQPDEGETSCGASSATARLPALALDEHRIAQRQKQVRFGKVTCGYKQYRYMVPTFHRQLGNSHHPATPCPHVPCSKRKWDAQVSEWRRALHAWDKVSTVAGAYELEVEGLPTRLQQGLERELELEAYLCATRQELLQMHDEVAAMGNLSDDAAGGCFGEGVASERSPTQAPQRCGVQRLKSNEFGSAATTVGCGRGGGSSPHALTSSDCASSPKLLARNRQHGDASVLGPSSGDTLHHHDDSARRLSIDGTISPPTIELPPPADQSVILSSEISTNDVSVASMTPATVQADRQLEVPAAPHTAPEYEFSVIGEWSDSADTSGVVPKNSTQQQAKAGGTGYSSFVPPASPIKRRATQAVSGSEETEKRTVHLDDNNNSSSSATTAAAHRDPFATVTRLASPQLCQSAASPSGSPAPTTAQRKSQADAAAMRRQVGSPGRSASGATQGLLLPVARCSQHYGPNGTSPIADVLLQHDTLSGGPASSIAAMAAALAANPHSVLMGGPVPRRMVVVIYVDGNSGTMASATTILTPLRGGGSASKRMLQAAASTAAVAAASSSGESSGLLGGSPPTPPVLGSTGAASCSATTVCSCGAVRTSPSICTTPAPSTPSFERGRELFSIDPRRPDEVLKALRGAFNLEKLTFVDPPAALAWKDQPITSSMLFAPTVVEKPLCTIEDVARWTDCAAAGGAAAPSDAPPLTPLLLLYRGNPPSTASMAAAPSRAPLSFDALEGSHNVPSPESVVGMMLSINPSPQTPSRPRQSSTTTVPTTTTTTTTASLRPRENSILSNASIAVQHQQSFCGASSTAGVAASQVPLIGSSGGGLPSHHQHQHFGGGVAGNASFANEEIMGALTFCAGHAISASPLAQLHSARLLNFGLLCDPSASFNESSGGHMNLDPTPTAAGVGDQAASRGAVDEA